LGKYDLPQMILFPALIISIGSFSTKYISGLNKTIGDFSYGIYLYAFPIQQIIVHFVQGITALQLMSISLPCAIIAGILSWHLIEKKALKLKQALSSSKKLVVS
jgi:peptidoglycan/LPS O-acetylase OafA/YrhL